MRSLSPVLLMNEAQAYYQVEQTDTAEQQEEEKDQAHREGTIASRSKGNGVDARMATCMQCVT